MKAGQGFQSFSQPNLSSWLRVGMALSLSTALLSLVACGSQTQPSDVTGDAQDQVGTDASGTADSTDNTADEGDSSDTTTADTGGDSADSTTYLGDYTLSVGSGAADTNDLAKSDEYSSSQSDKTLQCSSGYFMMGLEVEYTTWGLYPSITYLRMTCGNVDGLTETKTAGKYNNGSLFPVGCSGNVTVYGYTQEYDNGDFMTSIKVAHDSYIKDMKAGCSDLSVTEADGILGSKVYTPVLSSPVYNMDYGSRVWGDYSRVQSNDTEQVIDCDGSDEVLSGVAMSYKSDSNEWALTMLQPICAKLTAKSNSGINWNLNLPALTSGVIFGY